MPPAPCSPLGSRPGEGHLTRDLSSRARRNCDAGARTAHHHRLDKGSGHLAQGDPPVTGLGGGNAAGRREHAWGRAAEARTGLCQDTAGGRIWTPRRQWIAEVPGGDGGGDHGGSEASPSCGRLPPMSSSACVCFLAHRDAVGRGHPLHRLRSRPPRQAGRHVGSIPPRRLRWRSAPGRPMR